MTVSQNIRIDLCQEKGETQEKMITFIIESDKMEKEVFVIEASRQEKPT